MFLTKPSQPLRDSSISVVIREGLFLLLESDSYGYFVSDRKTATADTMPERADIVTEMLSDRNKVTGESGTALQAFLSDMKEAMREIVSDRNGATPETTSQSSGMPPFDTTKYVLGKLCPRQHDYDGTGHSLLRLSNRHCLACDREKFHERKQAKRQAERVSS